MAKTNTTWTEDNPGPGRPKGSVGWKNQALQLIGEVYKDREKEAREYLKELGIERFLERFVLPFVPKDINLGLTEETQMTFADWIKKMNEKKGRE